MDRDTDQPLTPAQAKALLRATARGAGPSAWLREHPASGMLLAFSAGWLAGRRPDRLAELLIRALECAWLVEDRPTRRRRRTRWPTRIERDR